MSSKLILNTLMLALLMMGGASVNFSHAESNISANTHEVTQNVLRASTHEKRDPTVDGSGILNDDQLGSTLLLDDVLSAVVTRSTTTNISQAYDVTFTSVIKGFTYDQRNVFTKIVDPDYNPFKEPPAKVDESQRAVFTGETMRIMNLPEVLKDKDGNEIRNSLVIPTLLHRGMRFNITIDTIGPDIVNPDDVDKVRDIVIPTGIKNIDPTAFVRLTGKDKVTFKVMSQENDDSLNFDASVFPAGTHVEWGYTPTPESDNVTKYIETDVVLPYEDFKNDGSYMVGYDDKKDLRLPLQLGYYIDEPGKDTEFKVMDLPIVSLTNHYNMISSNTIEMNIDIPLEENQVVDDDNLYFFNVFEAKQESDGQWYPLTSTAEDNNAYYLHGKPSYDSKESLDEFISYKFNRVTTFGDYTSIKGKIDVVDGIYQKLKGDVYDENVDDLETGKKLIRTRFINLPSANLEITYRVNNVEKTISVKIDSRYDYYNLPGTKNVDIAFLFKNDKLAEDFNPNEITGIKLTNFYICLDMVEIGDKISVVTKSAITTRFGIMDFMENTGEPSHVSNIDHLIGIIVGTYVGIFLIVSITYFFIAKNKYKNDEFRRVNPKLFLKKSIIAFFAIGFVLLAGLFIYIRFWPLNNSSVVYNPTDIPVTIFSIAALFAIGYYIRYFVIAFRAWKEKKKTEKLKLNEDVDDDGTK